MKGDLVWQIIEEVGADGVELFLPEGNREPGDFSYIECYTKKEWEYTIRLNLWKWVPWFWKEMNGKINYLFEISKYEYLKWTEERKPYHRMSEYHNLSWENFMKLLK